MSGGTVCASITFSSPSTIDISSNDDTVLHFVVDIIESALRKVFSIFNMELKNCSLLKTSACHRVMNVPLNLWKCVSLPESILNRRLILEIVAQLELAGYRLSTCIDFRGTADSLFFIKSIKTFQNQPKEYFILSAHHCDLLRLISAPKDIIDVTRLLLNQNWSQGLHSEHANTSWHEFQFCALPWASRGADAVESHSMLTSLLQTYLARGWVPLISVQLSRTFKDRSCIILRKDKPSYRPHVCLGLLESNELHLINADDCLREYIIDTIFPKANIPKSRFHKTSTKWGWPFLSLPGEPWCNMSLANHAHIDNGHRGDPKSDPYDFLKARVFVQNLLAALQTRGWEVVISVDLAARLRYRRKSSAGSSGRTRRSLSFGDTMSMSPCEGESNIPLDVNSLILANKNGSRHNSSIKHIN